MSKKAKSKTTSKKSAQRSQANIDWSKAKKWYLEDVTRSYRDVAKKFKVSKSAVERHSRNDKNGTWTKQRQELGEKADSAWIDNEVERRAELNKRHSGLYRRLQDMALTVVGFFEQGDLVYDRKGNVITDKNGDPLRVPPDAKSVEHVVKAIKYAIDGERATSGLPSDVKGLTDGKGESLAEGLAEVLDKAEKRYEEMRKNGTLAGRSEDSRKVS